MGVSMQRADGGLHQNFGIRTGDEAIGANGKGATHKFPLAQDILQRLTGEAAGDGGLQLRTIKEAVSLGH